MVTIVLIILGILIVLVSSITAGNIAFNKQVEKEVKELFKKSKERNLEENLERNREVITEEDIIGLPEPVQRYLRYTGIIGKEKIRTVRLKQKGFFRTKEDRKWMPIEAEEYYTVDAPAFVWYGKIRYVPFISIRGMDKFGEGRGSMLIKLSLLKIVDATGYELDQGGLVRYLNEVFWFPAAYLSDYIDWEPIDSASAKATISVQGMTASAVLHFNEKGELTNFVAERYRSVDGGFVKDVWSTPITEYREMNGIMVPSKGEAIWNLSSGEFSYYRLELTDIEYDNPSIY